MRWRRVLMATSVLLALAAELAALKRQVEGLAPKPEQFTVDGAVGQHVPQRAFVLDESQWQQAMCARQSGKSYGDDIKLFQNAKRFPRSPNVLLGLKGTAVRENNWETIWKPLAWRYGIPERCLNETRMSCEFDNGSRVVFGGTADSSHILNQLGKNLNNGLFIIDESQDQRDKVLTPLIDQILPPMMSPTTKVVMSGVIPEVPAGRFFREWTASRWSRHNWGRFANVHTPAARAQFDQYLRDSGLTEQDARIQRDWFGRIVFDDSARAFRYVAARNGYDGAIPEDVLRRLTTFSVGIDPGAFDRCAIVVVGWGEGTGLWVVEEWVTDRNSGTVWSQIGEELGRIQRRWHPSWYFADFGGAKMTLDVFGRDHGVPIVAAAKKADRRGQVDRYNDLFQRGEAHVPVGSALEDDLIKTQWDKDARARGEFEWSSHNHPDVADAFRYAAHPFIDLEAKEHVPEDKTPSVARRLKLLKDKNEGGQEGYFERKRRELG